MNKSGQWITLFCNALCISAINHHLCLHWMKMNDNNNQNSKRKRNAPTKIAKETCK